MLIQLKYLCAYLCGYENVVWNKSIKSPSKMVKTMNSHAIKRKKNIIHRDVFVCMRMKMRESVKRKKKRNGYKWANKNGTERGAESVANRNLFDLRVDLMLAHILLLLLLFHQ